MAYTCAASIPAVLTFPSVAVRVVTSPTMHVSWHVSALGVLVEQEERSRAISFIFSGLHVGSLAGLLVAPPLIEHFGWEVVFYIFGVTGTLACSYFAF